MPYKDKETRKEYINQYRIENKEKIKEQKKQYRIDNKEKIKQYRIDNKEKIRGYDKQYYINNKEKKKQYYINNKEKNKQYRIKNKEKIRKYKNQYKINRYKTDPLYKFKTYLRNRLKDRLKSYGGKNNRRTNEILGISVNDFRTYLESKFEPWMTWDNYGLYNGELNYGWDIDHIIPTSSASTIEEIIKLNHYSNLRPLCSKVNRDIKKNKVID